MLVVASSIGGPWFGIPVAATTTLKLVVPLLMVVRRRVRLLVSSVWVQLFLFRFPEKLSFRLRNPVLRDLILFREVGCMLHVAMIVLRCPSALTVRRLVTLVLSISVPVG